MDTCRFFFFFFFFRDTADLPGNIFSVDALSDIPGHGMKGQIPSQLINGVLLRICTWYVTSNVNCA